MKNLAVLIFCTLMLLSCRGKEKGKTEAEIVLSFVTQDQPNSPAYAGYEAFADKLKELSGGTMVIEPITLSTKDTLGEMFSTVITGDFDIVKTWYWDMDYMVPEISILGEVYVIKDYEHLMRIMESDYGNKKLEQFAKNGILVSSLWYDGTRYVTSNKPIESLADFKGLKYRIPLTKSIVAFAQALATEPIQTPFVDIYDGLASGKLDAQGNPILTIDRAEFYKVQKYIAATEHLVGVTSLFINKEKYESFTDQQKAWYDEAVEYGRVKCAEFVYEREAQLLDKFQNEYAMILTHPNKDELRAAMQSHYQQIEKQYGEGSITSILAIE